MHVTIYGIFDPRDGEIRYVGRTRNPVEVRLAQHQTVTKSGSRTHLARWINELASAGIMPEIASLELTTEAEASIRERFWIERLVGEGVRLVNTEFCQKYARFEDEKRAREEHQRNAMARAEAHFVAHPPPKVPRMTPEEIRDFRSKLGMSQGDLAQALGYHNSTLSCWESGKRTPPPGLSTLLEKVAKGTTS